MPQVVTIIGQGYVGLPLAQAVISAGFFVYGLDHSSAVVATLNAGRSHVDDLTDDDVRAMLGRGYRATTDAAVIGASDVVLICVPTPLSEAGGPDLDAVLQATHVVSEHLVPGCLVILESTTYPGTTEDVVLPLLRAGPRQLDDDFFLAFSPERVDPGSPQFSVRNTPKLVGGVSAASSERAVAFYRSFVDDVVALSGAREAETAKLLENTYRHVNIALVNEMARFCHDLGINIWEVIRGASTKPFGFQEFRPGPGVGGHCIPIDPNYLGHEVRRKLGYSFRFVELAQEINSTMPAYVVGRVGDLLNDHSRSIRGSTVLLLGVTYKPDIADLRASPALPLAEILRAKGALVQFHDPLVPQWEVEDATLRCVPDLYAAVATADVVILVQDHNPYDADALAAAARVFFDTRGVTTTGAAHRL